LSVAPTAFGKRGEDRELVFAFTEACVVPTRTG
jgi:hypothetical protein